MTAVVTMEEAVAAVPSGAVLGIGGVLLKRKPIVFLAALGAAGVRDLEAVCFLASLGIEVLAAHDALSRVATGYVGFEQLGPAPAYQQAVAAGRIEVAEYTEFLFVAGLRAAMAGLPFMPTKGGAGSDVLEELGFAEIEDPYGGPPVIAVPALRPDFAVIHAEAADERGNVLGPTSPDFLYDYDATIARAAGRAIVTVEQVVDSTVLARDPRPALLYGYEVDYVVEAPGGGRPGAMPSAYAADVERIRAYLAEVRSGMEPLDAIGTLV